MADNILTYNFGSAASGLQFDIKVVYSATLGTTTFTVVVNIGALNVNAIYWKDSDSTFDGVVSNALATTTFYQENLANGAETAWDPNAKADANLNMNGANVVWNPDGTSTTEKEVWDG